MTGINSYSYVDSDIDGDEFGVHVGRDFTEDYDRYVDPERVVIEITHDDGDLFADLSIEEAVAFAKGIVLAVEIAKMNS